MVSSTPYPLRIPGRPDFDNVTKLDLMMYPLASWMMRVGTAIDTDQLKRLDLEFEEQAQALQSNIYRSFSRSQLNMVTYGRYDAPSADEVAELELTNDRRRDLLDTGDLNFQFNIDSSVQVARVLFDELGLGRKKNLKTTNDGSRYTTGKQQLELLREEHELVGMILEYREIRKLQSTYVKTLPKLAVWHPKSEVSCPVCGYRHRAGSWRVHTKFVLTRTETGRLASRQPNLQNIPAKTDRGRAVRKCFIPTPGNVWVSADLSQIELRVLADHTGEEKMIWCYSNGVDLHSQTAAWVYGKKLADVDKDTERYPMKTINFLIAYGGTAVGMQASLAVAAGVFNQPSLYWTRAQTEATLSGWHAAYPSVAPYMLGWKRAALRYGISWEFLGGWRYIPEAHDIDERIREEGFRKAGNHPIQGGAGGINKAGAVGIYQETKEMYDGGLDVLPLLNVHDEYNLEAEPCVADYVKVMMGEEMSMGLKKLTGHELRVPIEADGKTMGCWEK